jgi:hypothetical protein
MAIQDSVGRNARNFPPDVRTVQQLLQGDISMLGPVMPVSPTGVCDAQTIYVIEIFQRNVLKMQQPTGRVEPGDQTWYGLNGQSGPATVPTGSAVLDESLQQLRDQFVDFGARFIQDSDVRADYVAKAQKYADEILDKVKRGELTPEQGAAEAQSMRNGLLDAARLKSSDIGKAAAELEKATGKTMEELLAKYSKQLFGREFAELATTEQDVVFVTIIKAAGRPNPRYTLLASRLGKAGKGLLIVSIAFSVYNIAESDRPGREAVKETASTGMGFLGSLAGGAAAGLVCGPGAPICSGVGVLVGGLVFALGTDLAFEHFWE